MGVASRMLRSSGLLAVLALVILGAAAAAATASDYGLSWDEPYFYAYADAVPYAYSLPNWLSSDFDLERAYGPSASDHKVYGPAYLLIGRPIAGLVEHVLDLDRSSAWHFVNALTFLLSVVLLFILSRRWLSAWAAFGGALLYAAQPMLWGHAFINPKDIPFLAFFLAAVTFGLRMVDQLCEGQEPERAVVGPDSPRHAEADGAAGEGLRRRLAYSAAWLQPYPSRPSLLPSRARVGAEIRAAILPGVVLGLASCLRVLGPAAGLLVMLAFLFQSRRRSVLGVSVYLLVAALTMYATWPYLWESPVSRFWEVIQRSAHNPTSLAVLFQGGLYSSSGLPRIYFPLLLGATLTEPTLLLSAIGIVVSLVWVVRRRIDWRTFVVVPMWFFAFAGYIVMAKPPMYDGIRHFLFILPPLFIFAGAAFEAAFSALRPSWARVGLMLLLLVPGVYGILETHPYEYAYYNQFVGRLSGAFRHFETDYWLTCYKEAVTRLNASHANGSPALYVFREPYIAQSYADSSIQVRQLDPEDFTAVPGDFLLLSSRTNEDRYFAEAPAVIVVGKGGATFCVVRQVGMVNPSTQ
jgi:hypothetical protein